jgi:hypothetical protein
VATKIYCNYNLGLGFDRRNMSHDVRWTPRCSHVSKFNTRWYEDYNWFIGLFTQVLGSVNWQGKYLTTRLEKREIAWEFSQLSCSGQTRTRVAWELRSERLHESFLNSHAPVKREQELHENWWELTSERLHESFLNSHVPVKFSTLMFQWELRIKIHTTTRKI